MDKLRNVSAISGSDGKGKKREGSSMVRRYCIALDLTMFSASVMARAGSPSVGRRAQGSTFLPRAIAARAESINVSGRVPQL